MKNIVSIIEIPVSDLDRAIRFYESALNLKIENAEMGDVTMGIIPSAAGTVNVVLAKGADFKPTNEGSVLYLYAGNDLQPMLDIIAKNGGKILVPKTEISPEIGFFAHFVDSEGNKMGLHSAH